MQATSLRDRYRVVEVLRRNSAGTLVEAIDEQKIELPGVRQRVAIQVVDETLSREREYLQRIGRLQCPVPSRHCKAVRCG